MRHVFLLAAMLMLGGCLSLSGPLREPYTAYLEAIVAENPEVLAVHVRKVSGGIVIVGEEPAPDAAFVTTLRPHPAGTLLRFERRVSRRGYTQNSQLLDRYNDVIEAWSGSENGLVPWHRARIIPQASAPTCVTDTLETGLMKLPDYEPEEESFQIIDEPPELVGGLEGLQRRATYPKTARRAGIEGTVMVQFVVEEDGGVSCADVMLGLPGGLNEEVLAVVNASEFRPGRVEGEPVKVRFWLPVKFRLR